MTVESFKQQYFSLHPKLYRVAFAILKNAEDAEDILQDAYCKLWDNRDKLSKIKQPESYCVTLVKNLCIDFIRSPKEMQNDSIEEYYYTDFSTVEDEVVNREILQKTRAIIKKLPEKQRKILELRSFAECSFEEIENITGESAANIRVLLSRARTTLKMKIKS